MTTNITLTSTEMSILDANPELMMRILNGVLIGSDDTVTISFSDEEEEEEYEDDCDCDCEDCDCDYDEDEDEDWDEDEDEDEDELTPFPIPTYPTPYGDGYAISHKDADDLLGSMIEICRHLGIEDDVAKNAFQSLCDRYHVTHVVDDDGKEEEEEGE